MGKAQPLDAKILFVDGVWRRMGDVAVGDAIASVDGAESRVVGVFPQGVKKVISREIEKDVLYLTNFLLLV
jgi:replicative DNA helicase